MKNLMMYASLLILITSCGELSYKRGAGVTDLEKDKSTCKAQGRETYEDCLSRKGWSTKNLSELNLFENLTLKNTTSTNLEIIKIGDTKAIAQPEVQSVKIGPVEATQPIDNNNPVVVAKEQTVETDSAQPAPQPVAPSKVYVVNSWWKAGVRDNAFSTDASACSASLGDEHKPNYTKQTFTAAFLVCMRDKNWKAFIKQN